MSILAKDTERYLVETMSIISWDMDEVLRKPKVSTNARIRRILLLMRLSGININSGRASLLRKIFSSKLSIMFLLIYAYILTIEMLMNPFGWVFEAGVSINEWISFAMWLLFQAASGEIVALWKRVNEICRKRNYQIRGFGSFHKVAALVSVYLMCLIGNIIWFHPRNLNFYANGFCLGFSQCVENAGLLMMFIGSTLEMYAYSVVPAFLMLVYCSLLDDVYSMVEGFRLTSMAIGDIADVDVPEMFRMHKKMWRVLRDMRDVFSTPLFVFTMLNYFTVVLYLSSEVVIFFKDEENHAGHWLYSTMILVYNVLAMLLFITVSSELSQAQRKLRGTWRDIYEDYIYTHPKIGSESGDYSESLKAIVDRQVVNMTAAEMFKIGKGIILPYVGTLATYTVVAITMTERPNSYR